MCFTLESHHATVIKSHTLWWLPLEIKKIGIVAIARSKFFSNRVINDWNSLSQFIVDYSSINEFKMLLDRHYNNCLFVTGFGKTRHLRTKINI